MNWETLNAQFNSLLDDEDASSFPEALRIIAFNRAQDYFASTHTAPLKRVTLNTSPDGDAAKLTIPNDLFQIGGLQDPDAGHWLEPNLIQPGDDAQTSGYFEINQEIYLPGGQSSVELWYYAKYPHVVDDTSLVSLPSWSEWAVMNLALSFLLTPDMMGQASLRRFQSRRDAGAPEDNPSRVQAQYHMNLYRDVVNRVRPQDRDALFKPGR